MKTTDLPRLHSVRADINEQLAQYYAERIARARAVHKDYAALWQSMETLGATNGKRLRPYIMLAVYEGLGGIAYDHVLPVAVALELLHTSMLMHDDIIDRDYVRYGQPNIAGQYRIKYASPQLDGVERDHYANAAALLAGDLALSGAYELILTSALPPEKKVAAGQILNKSVFAVAGGELLDTEAVLQPFDSVDPLVIAHLKTAAYSFIHPLLMAATLAGAGEAKQQALEEMGAALGIAYQLADDVLGLFGDETVTGKPSTGDIAEGKRTYVMQRAIVLASAADRARLEAALGHGAVTPADAAEVRRIVARCGALDETRALMRSYADDAGRALHRAGLHSGVESELRQLIRRAIERQS